MQIAKARPPLLGKHSWLAQRMPRSLLWVENGNPVFFEVPW